MKVEMNLRKVSIPCTPEFLVPRPGVCRATAPKTAQCKKSKGHSGTTTEAKFVTFSSTLTLLLIKL